MSTAAIKLIISAVQEGNPEQSLRRIDAAAKDLKQDVKGVADTLGLSTQKAGQFIDKAGRLHEANGAFAKMKQDADGAGGAIGGLTTRVQSLGLSLQEVRGSALAVAAIGAGGVMLSNALIKVASDADNAEQRLRGLLDSQKRLGDQGSIDASINDISAKAGLRSIAPIRQAATTLASDEVKTQDIQPLLEASVRNAETLKKPLDAVSEAFAKAYAEGSLSRLRRINILFSDQEEASVAAAFGISRAAGQLEFMRVVAAATARDTDKLGAGLTDLQKRANENARSLEASQIAIGRGSQEADNQIKGLGATLLHLVGANDAVASSTGWVLTWGSYVASAIGSTVSFAAQIAILRNAQAGASIAATEDAAANTTLAAAEVEAGVAAEEASVAFTGAGLAVAGIGIAAAATVGYVAYAIGQHLGWFDKEKSYLDDLTDGWNALKDSITGASSAEFGVNQRNLAAANSKIEADKADAVLSGKKTEEQATKDMLKKKADLYEKFAKNDKASGDTESEIKNQKLAEQYKQQLAGATAPMPALPVTTPVTTSPVTPMTVAASAAGGLVAPSGSATTGATNPYEFEIRSLEDQKAALTGKANNDKRDVLNEQLRQLRRASSDWKRDHAEEVKAENKTEREAERAKKVSDKDDLAIAKAKEDIARADQIADLQDKLDAAREAHDSAKIRSLSESIARIKALQEYDNALAAANQEEPGKHQNSLREIAGLELQADNRRARREGEKAANSSDGSDSKKTGLSPRQILDIMQKTGNGAAALHFAALNPGAGEAAGRYDGLGIHPSLWNGANIGGGYTLGIPGAGGIPDVAAAKSAAQQERIAKVKSKVIQQGQTRYIEFERVPLPPERGLADVEVD